MKRFRQILITVFIFLLLFSAMAYGITWTADKRLTNNLGDSNDPDIAVEGSNIYVVWHDSTPENYEIYFKKSDDGGITWKASKRLTYTTGDSAFPAIAVNGLNIYVAWDTYFKRSDDGGITWKAIKTFTDIGGDSPAIAADSSGIYVVWFYLIPPGYAEIYFKKGNLY